MKLHSSENAASFALLLALAAPPVGAQIVTPYTYTTFGVGGDPSLVIPDGNPLGVSDSRTVVSSQSSIVSVKVMLDLAGDFNGDLYLTLRHETGLSVLLNRPGRTGANPFGYDDSGFNITFADGAANGDIHNYQAVITPSANTQLTGDWQPDARNDGLGLAFDTDSRDAGAFLSAFTGMNPNGEWTLVAADLMGGGESQIQSWGLEISAVPEPAHVALAAGVAALGFGLLRRARRARAAH